MKKILACLCSLSLVFSVAVCSLTANAAEAVKKSGWDNVTYGGISYLISVDDATVTGIDEAVYSAYNPDYADTKIFSFPKEIKYLETGEVKPVTAIDGIYRDVTFKKIIIPNSVLSINSYSFQYNETFILYGQQRIQRLY